MNRNREKNRRGISLTEVLVAATLVISMIGILAPMTARVGNAWQSTRQYRLAMNELANQMDSLTSLGLEKCRAALPELAPSPALSDSLPGVSLNEQIVQDVDGTRLLLQLDWDRVSNAVPLSLVGWLDTDPVSDKPTAYEPIKPARENSESVVSETLAASGVKP